MDNLKQNKIILALETGLDGGSVSILRNGNQLDGIRGAEDLSKAEDILPIIENLLNKNGIDKREIGLVAVSDEPGSLTGLRIGLAVAIGLANSLVVDVYRTSVLEVLTYQLGLEGRVISAIYTRKNGVFYREFLIKNRQRERVGEIVQVSGHFEFIDKLEALKGEKISVILNKNLKQLIANRAENLEDVSFFSIESNFAEVIGQFATIGASDNETQTVS